MSEIWTVFTACKAEISASKASKTQIVTGNALTMLKALFPETTIGNAVKLVEQESVLRVQRDGDYFYKVEGSHGEEYHVMKELTFCPCPAYRQILAKNNQLMVSSRQCKHLLALHIGEALQSIKWLEVDPQDFTPLFFSKK